MVQRTGGSRRKTRSIFKKKISERGKISIRNYLQRFNMGDKVILQAEPSVQKGIYFRRFHSKTGTIIKERGHCYEVSIKDGNKNKIVITHPIHLKKCLK